MGREIAGDRDEDVSASVSVVPLGELPNSRLQHLIGMEAWIFAKQRTRGCANQSLRRMAELLVFVACLKILTQCCNAER
jgi:hypothetical protein